MIQYTDMDEDKIRQIVKEEIAPLTAKVDNLSEDVSGLKESNEVLREKMDALLTMSENFIGKVETEEQERKMGYKQLERRVEKLEERV